MSTNPDPMIDAIFFIGAKLLKAIRMNSVEATKFLGRDVDTNHEEDRLGYLVEYEDGYRSWSPKGVFETAYREVEL